MSKEYYRNSIANKRKEMVGLRTDIVELKERKARRMQTLASNIKSASTPSSKENYRKQKISEAENFTREIERKREKIEDIKRQIESLKRSLANAK